MYVLFVWEVENTLFDTQAYRVLEIFFLISGLCVLYTVHLYATQCIWQLSNNVSVYDSGIYSFFTISDCACVRVFGP
jgi:hypothetical protein